MTTSPAGAPLRLVIADDQASVRQGLVLLLDAVPGIEVVGAAADGERALDLVTEYHPDAILLDLHMPVLDGIGAIRRLTAEHPEVAIVVLTTYADDSSVLDALRAGARSYLTKDADYTEIAAQLFRSNHTVKTHISRIFAKTGSRDRAAAIGYAHRHDIG